MKVGFIGCGNMGGTLASVAAKSGEEVYIADHNQDKLYVLQKLHNCIPSSSDDIAKECNIIFMGVKPQVIKKAASEIEDILEKRKGDFLIVSMAAGVTIDAVADMFSRGRVIRIMPNTPAAVGEGVILYSTGDDVTEKDENAFLKLMEGAGILIRLDESKIDMGSAVTGCGPAFVCLLMEAMIDAGVRIGLPRDKAEIFTLQTFEGTARLAIESKKDPAELRVAVCSPGGSTIEGVAALEKNGARNAVMEAVMASYERTKELGK